MFSAKHLKIGRLGEDIACQFLKENNWKIILRNYTKPWGEIDIIAQKDKGPLVFFEIKSLEKIRQSDHSSFAELNPEDNLTSQKLKKLEKACESFANSNSGLINENKGWRIDLISIAIQKGVEADTILTNIEKYCEIKHYPNIS